MKTKLLTLHALHLGLAAVVAQPVITNQPTWQTNIVGGTAMFSVEAAGTPPLLYQWRRETAGLPGQTNSTLVLTNLQLSQRSQYSVVVANLEGSVTSSLARLYVLTPPTITPANPTASLFADLALFGTNAAAGPVAYQWLLNDAPIAGAVTNKLLLTNVQKTNAGAAYAFVVTYAFGSVTSQVATLKITPFNSIYFFGDSWTDTGGNGCTWPPPDYYGNRACNGPMWPEFLTADLELNYSDSAQNNAHCGDVSAQFLGQVTNRFRPSVKPQLSLYAFQVPTLDLFVMYPGGYQGVYVDPTNQVAVTQIIDMAVRNASNAVESLYAKGSRAFLYMNQNGTNAPDVPVLGGYRAGLFDAHVRSYNVQFRAAMNAISRSYADVRICEVDLYALWDKVSTRPAAYGFTDILTPGLSETNRAFDGPGASHLYWDGIAGHATSKFHGYMAAWNLDSLRTNVFEEMVLSVTNETAMVEMNHLLIGHDYTLQTSSDLLNWNDVQTFTASAGTNRVTQALSVEAASVFYRLQWQH